jgi:hypothetical protein
MMFTTAFIKCDLVPGYQNWSDKEQEGKELKSYKAGHTQTRTSIVQHKTDLIIVNTTAAEITILNSDNDAGKVHYCCC